MNKAAEHVKRNREVHEAIEGALRDIETHAGEVGFRHLYDKALHVKVAIRQAGFAIVRQRAKKPESP
jgi:hypothetical protein